MSESGELCSERGAAELLVIDQLLMIYFLALSSLSISLHSSRCRRLSLYYLHSTRSRSIPLLISLSLAVTTTPISPARYRSRAWSRL
jgi:hypothetical protein